MAHNLTEADSYDANVTVPDDGDAEVAASVVTAFQSLADRTNKHKNDLAFLSSGGRTASDGVKHIRRVATTTALKTLSGMGDGEIAWVDSAQSPYRFDSGASTTEDLPWVAQPNVGSGRWFRANYGDLSAAGGLPRLDGSGKVSLANLPKGCQAFVTLISVNPTLEVVGSTAYLGTTISTSYSDIPNSGTLTGLQSGDIVRLSGAIRAQFTPAAAGKHGYIQLLAGANILQVLTLFDVAAGSAGPDILLNFAPPDLVVGVGVSSLVVKSQYRVEQAGGGLSAGAPYIVRAQVIRP